MKSILSTLTLAAAITTLAGCSSTSQPGRSTTLGEENLNGSGFLAGIYPLMKEGEDDESLRLYRNPKYASSATFVQYKKVLLDPIKLYADSNSKLHEEPQEGSNTIVQGFYNQLHEQLSKDYQMVDQAGPDTLQVSIAIVHAEASNTSLKAASYIPIPLGVPGLKVVAVQTVTHTTGQPPFTGQVTIEGKLTDAQSGEVITALIDRRTGSRRPIIGLFESSTYDSWSDVTEAEKYWAEKLRYGLCIRRAASNCVEAVE